MAFCSKCGNQLAENQKFCIKCGAPTGGATVPKPVVEKVGNIRKCPACGAEVPSMTAICSDCGHEFSNVQVSSTVRSFFEKLDAISQEVFEKAAAEEAKGPVGGAWGVALGIDRMARMGKTFRGINAGTKRQIGLIEGYPIPNSKEDILEFLLLASSRYKGIRRPLIPVAEKMEAFKLDDVWRVKCEQAYIKAKILLKSDKDGIVEIQNILKLNKKLNRKLKKAVGKE